MSCKEEKHGVFRARISREHQMNHDGMISFCEQASNEKNFQLISTYVYSYRVSTSSYLCTCFAEISSERT